MFILDILTEIVGYSTARFLLPILSLQRVHAEPVRPNNKGQFNWMGYRFDGNNGIEVEATMAGWIGLAFWTAILIVVLILV